MQWLLKLIGWEVLRAGLRKLIFTTIISPQIERFTAWGKEYIDDPETDGDEELAKALDKMLKYKADKWLGKLLG